ncbi:lipoyl(octanoyl) transferase LipB [Spirochaetia bacterium 38H-sp]|uniref:Octanoyltransferase n=1 Tax=Rarispira pelagica TaxID=3141764 RepID=A0ABU9UDU9_9SPIR
MDMQKANIIQLGYMDYKEAWDIQHRLHTLRKEDKIIDTILIVEHPHVITMGTRNKSELILLSQEELKAKSVSVYKTERGGEVTYHGPGQLVIYFIIKIQKGLSVKKLVHDIEEAAIRALSEVGIKAGRDEKHPGVWTGNDKIMALGIAIRDRVTMHGLALNVTTDLSCFDWIVPCGIKDRGVTSIEKETGTTYSLEEIATIYARHFAELFSYNLSAAELSDVLSL